MLQVTAQRGGLAQVIPCVVRSRVILPPTFVSVASILYYKLGHIQVAVPQ